MRETRVEQPGDTRIALSATDSLTFRDSIRYKNLSVSVCTCALDKLHNYATFTYEKEFQSIENV